MPTPLETAVIEIVADTSGFGKSLLPDVEKAVEQAREAMEKAFTNAEGEVKESFKRLEIEFDRFGQAGEANIENLVALFTELDKKLKTSRAEGAELARKGLKPITNAITELESAIATGPTKAFRDLSTTTQRTGQRIRAVLGRAALAGVDNLDESLNDVAQTMEKEVRQAVVSLRKNLQRLGDVPGLKRLEQQIEDTGEAALDDLARPLRTVQATLERMAEQGTLTQRELNRAISLVAVNTEDLDDSFKEIRNTLRRLAGDSNVFREMVADVDRAENETRDFANALRRADNAAEGVDDGLRQAALSARRLGDGRGSRGVSRLIANLNRARFVALDLRFILTGVGLALAGRFAEFGIEAASSLEQLNLSLQAIAKSISQDFDRPFTDFADAASVSFDRIVESARETPFSIEEVAEATRRLVAFVPSFGTLGDGVDNLSTRTESAIDIFETLGGTLALLGNTEGLNRVIKALGDIGARGKLTGEEIRQLANALPGIDLRETIVRGLAAGIEGFEELNSAIAFTGDNLPEAVERFNQLQEQGLVPAEAAIQGLVGGMNQLFDTEEALRAFTLTIEGSMEKLREAAQIGLSRGLEPLGRVLTDVLPEAIELVEDASESFGEGLTDLASSSIPLILEAASELADIFGDAASALAEFLGSNRNELSQSISLAAGSVRSFSRAFAPVANEFAPLLLQLVEIIADVSAGFETLSRVSGGLFPGLVNSLETVLDLFNSLPGVVQAGAVAAFIIFRKQIKGLIVDFRVAQASAVGLGTQLSTGAVGPALSRTSAAIATLRGNLSQFRAQLGSIARIGGIAALVGFAGRATDAFKALNVTAAEVAKRFQGIVSPVSDATEIFSILERDILESESALARNTVAIADLKGAYDAVTSSEINPQLEEANDSLHRQAPSVGHLAGAWKALTDIFNENGAIETAKDLGELTEEQRAHREVVARSQRTIETLTSNTFPRLRRGINLTLDGFSGFSGNLRVTNEQLLEMAQLGGPQAAQALEDFREELITEDDLLEIFANSLSRAEGEAGGFIKLLGGAGVDVSSFTRALDGQSASAETLSEAFDAATLSLSNFVSEQRKQTDPVFALFDALEARRDAVEAFNEAEGEERGAALTDAIKTQEELNTAVINFGTAVANNETSIDTARAAFEGLLAQIDGIAGGEQLLADLFNQLPDTIRNTLVASGLFTETAIEGRIIPALESGRGALEEFATSFDVVGTASERLGDDVESQLTRIADLARNTEFTLPDLKTIFGGDNSEIFRQAQDIGVQAGDEVALAIEKQLITGLGEVARSPKVSGAARDLSGALIDGVAGGIDSGESRRKVSDAVFSVANLSVTLLENFLQISSPSRVTFRIGSDFVQGYIDGINSRRGDLVTALNSFNSAVGSVAPPTNAPTSGPVNNSTTFSNNFTVNAPNPEQAANNVATELGDFVYLNGDKFVQ